MKFKKVIFIFAATGSIVAASPSPHRHHHKHIEKRTPETKIITVNEYEIGGRPATLEEVCAGLKAKTLKVPDGGTVPQCSDDGSPVQHAYAYGGQKGHGDHNKHHGGHKGHGQSQQKASSSSLIVVSSVTPVAPVAPSSKPYVESSTPAPSLSSSSTPVSSSPAEKPSSPAEKPSSPSTGTSDSHDGQGVDREFPDCEIDCSQFPSDYGPIAIDWMKIGGWSGIQYPTIQGNVITRIDTAVPGGKNCVPGAMCSYACPPGYQKSQWPLAQGSTGESVGGLLCDNQGKLKLTNSGLSNRLCIKGTGGVQVQNDLKGSDNVAICRTDYPGQCCALHY